MSILVVDVGTSGVRAVVVRDDGSIALERREPMLPSTPNPGFVEFDAAALAAACVRVARAAAVDGGPIDAVGITNQRASTIVWDRATGEPVGPGVGWQDLRTVGMCLLLQAQGIRLSPSASATKLGFLLDMADPERQRSLCFGTVDTWVAWTLSERTLHVTDLSNAAITGLQEPDGSGWSPQVLEALRIPESLLPDVVDTSGVVGEARALPGAPPIASLVGDQQASLVGQGCVTPGSAKVTFGTGGMLDVCVGPERPAFATRGPAGTFPIVAWRAGGASVWGLEAVMLAAGTNVSWLRDDLGIIDDVAESHDVAARCDDAMGVVFVPALLGLGTPWWDYGARGTLLGLTRGVGRPQLVRAVLEGVAQRGADLLEAAEADAGLTIAALRVDGGMSANPTFVQALADATGRPVEVSPVTEATALGAAFHAGVAVGTWPSLEQTAELWQPRQVVDPARRLDRDRWAEACSRARNWVPELSALDF